MKSQPKVNPLKITQKEAIRFYKVLIEGNLPHKEFRTINSLIIEKWSIKGLETIKNKAWRELVKEDPAKYAS